MLIKKQLKKNLVLKLVHSLKLILVISFFELMELKYFNLSLEKRQFADSVLFFYALPSRKKEKISIPHSIWHNQNYYTDDKNCKETQLKYNKPK